jgi:hypothetical protein
MIRRESHLAQMTGVQQSRRDSELEREERSARLLRLTTFSNRCYRCTPCCGEHPAEDRGCRGRTRTEHLSQPVVFGSRRRAGMDD